MEYTSLFEKKKKLDALRPLKGDALRALQKFYDIELTYTSNAIEGNTLTHRETAEVIEHGITVGGKTLREHLEAVDHYQALQWMREQAERRIVLCENTITELHRQIVLRSHPDIAGIYSRYPRRISGSMVTFPNPAKIPALMEELGKWLENSLTENEILSEKAFQNAFEAHFRLVAIHPFSDGNGRTARLLMNLMLLRSGYPPIAVRPLDRRTYLESLEKASLSQDLTPFFDMMTNRLEETLSDYIQVLEESL